MSSDYISRLRGELLRAGAAHEARPRRIWERGGAAGGVRGPRRRRPARSLRRLRPLAGVVALALVVAAVVFAVPRERADDTAVPPARSTQLEYRASPGAAEVTAEVLRRRLDAAGIRSATVSISGGEIRVAAPPDTRNDVIALMETGRLWFYYWEDTVLGPDGKTDPGDPAVTGGADAGRAGAATKAEAHARADRHRDARVVRAERGDGYFALAGPPAITNTTLASARAAIDPATQEPIVVLEFTEKGQRAFQDVTREVAQGGADYALGGDPLTTSHHLAIVVDDRIMSMPFINWQDNPDGIDGALGAQIAVATTGEARLLAAILNSPPLP